MAVKRRRAPGDFAAVLDAARAGDERAWAQLIGDLAPALVGYLRMRGATDPEDLAGEALLRVARNIGRFQGDAAKFRSWAFTIAHRQLIDEHRRSTRGAKVLSFDDAALTSEPARSDVEDALALQWSSDGSRALLAQLSPDQRDVVLLRLVGGFAITEVAEILGKEPNAVKQLQHRGVHALRRILAAAGGSGPTRPTTPTTGIVR